MRTLKSKPCFENIEQGKHSEFETRNTRVSEYLRKYGTGRIDAMPTDPRPEVTDNRTTDQMLDDVDKLSNNLGTEELDVLIEMQNRKEEFEKAFADIKLTASQKEKFDSAIAVLNDKNSTYEQQSDAVRILEELEQTKKISRARN